MPALLCACNIIALVGVVLFAGCTVFELFGGGDAKDEEGIGDV